MPLTPKRKSSLVTVGTTLVMLLQDEKVRRALRNGSASVRTWAKERRSDEIVVPSPDHRSPVRKVKESFGQGSLERRVDSLDAIIPEFETTAPAFAAELRRVEGELRRAVTVTGRLPASKRWRAQRDISRRLDQIESSLVDAVLSPPTPPTPPAPPAPPPPPSGQ